MIDKKQLTTVAHQVAGHGQDNKNIGLLQDGDTVLKPIHLTKKAGKCELEFYERMIHNLPKSLTPFLPRYYGQEQVIDSSTKSVQGLYLDRCIRNSMSFFFTHYIGNTNVVIAII